MLTRDSFNLNSGNERETSLHTMASISSSGKGVGFSAYFGPRFWE